jgi:hypothetical protein
MELLGYLHNISFGAYGVLTDAMDVGDPSAMTATKKFLRLNLESICANYQYRQLPLKSILRHTKTKIRQ